MLSADPSSSPTVLRIETASLRYRRGDHPQLRNVSLDLRRADRCVVMGHNGSGKTTLLRACAGLLRPMQGTAQWYDGHDWRTLRRPVADIGYIPQNLGLVRTRTALANVQAGTLGRVRGWRRLLGHPGAGGRAESLGWLRRLGLDHKAHERVDRLSGGERQRVAIARSLVQRPAILIADEFVSSLDLVRQAEVLRLLRDHAQQTNLTLLVALHDFEIARQFATRFVFVKNGEIAADLPAADVDLEVARRFVET